MPEVRATGLGQSKAFLHGEKTASPVCRRGLCCGLSCPSAAFAAPGAALAPASPTRTPCRALLGPRPLIDGEDATNYDVILERISADVAPEDFVEEMWVRNVVDLVWDSVRLRRLKSQLLHAAAHEGLARMLTPLLDWAGAGQLARTWASGDEEAVCEVERLLGRAGLTIDAVMAQTLAARIDDVERIDRMPAPAPLPPLARKRGRGAASASYAPTVSASPPALARPRPPARRVRRRMPASTASTYR